MPASPRFPDLPSGWKETTEQLEPLKTFVRFWTKEPRTENPRVLFLVHGWGEHSDRYRHWPHYLQNEIDMIVISDLYGHGQSPGAKGSCRTSEDWLGGVELSFKTMESRLKSEGRRATISVLGHSFGGLVTLELARQERWHSARELFLSAPLLGLVHEPPAWKTFLGRMIEPFAPQLPLANDIDAAVVSHDPEVVAHYTADPLNHGLITPRAYQQMTEMIARQVGASSPLKWPVTLLSPLADPLVSEPIAAKWFQRLDAGKGAPKQRVTFTGFRHESFNELEKERAFTELASRLGR
ncbi:MAG: alpha/beta fold hydrolase [Bdellovibrionaceae bacterium]|nr:alpha/beta fold hydrolase [Pseudobdellovibrionaceae bacterium]